MIFSTSLPLLRGWRLACGLVVAALLGHTHPAAAHPARAAVQPVPGQSVSAVLNPDGTLRPGVSGSFDATGYRMVTDAATGRPTFRPASPQGAGDEKWQDGIRVAGTVEAVSALATSPTGDLYMGGGGSVAGGVLISGVARWNGTAWAALDASYGTFVNTNALAVSSSGVLYVGSQIFTPGSLSAYKVLRWDGTTWSDLGSVNTGGVIQALAVSSTDEVYVGGLFTSVGGVTVSNIARWNGTAWSALGSGVNGRVRALVAGTTGHVYVGGDFTTANASPANAVARWDGAAWSALGSGLTATFGTAGPSVRALAYSSTGDLYAGGSFNRADGVVVANNIAKWNGGSWSALGTGTVGAVNALAASGTTVYATGTLTSAGSVTANKVAKWDGAAWQAMGSGIPPASSTTYGSALAVVGSDVYIGGRFWTIGGLPANHIARWNATAWSALTPGLNGAVKAVAVSGSTLYAAYIRPFNDHTSYIVKWDGTSWTNLGAGVNGAVNAMTVASSGELFVGGVFTQAGSVAANNVAKWNGASWSALGSGVTGSNLEVYTLALEPSGELFAGSSSGLQKWSPFTSTWSTVGSSGPAGDVRALLYDDATNILYVGGSFILGGSLRHVARWNGTSWLSLGSGMTSGGTPRVHALALTSSGVLYAAGTFSAAGGTAAANIARWNGSAWSALGTGTNDVVSTLTTLGNDLYVGGNFTAAGGVTSTTYIAKWNGSAWSSIGTGLNFSVASLTTAGTNIYAGGAFTRVGDGSKATPYVGIYRTVFTNAAPTALGLSPQSVTENTPGGTAIGTFSTTDPDAGNTHTYSLVSGTGAADNGAFSISGSQLLITASPDFEDQPSYAIRVRTTDGGGLSFEQAFTITVTNVIEVPTITSVSPPTGQAGDVVIISGANYERVVGGGTGSGTTSTGAQRNAAPAAITSVEFNGIPAAFTILSPTQVQATVPVGATSGFITLTTPEGSATSPTSFAVTYPSLTISTAAQTIPANTYQDITITGTGAATLLADVVVMGTLRVQADGRLATNCFTVSGPGAFVLAARAELTVCDPQGISASGATGAVQTAGGRTFSPHASYGYNGTAAQVTGTGLPSQVLVLAQLSNQPLTLSRPVAVRQEVQLAFAGNLTLNGQALTLLSDADSTAFVANLGSGAVVGPVTVQRYVGGGAATGFGYRHLAAPVVTTTVADLATPQFAPRVNPAYNVLPAPALPAASFPNVFFFDEARGGAANQNFAVGYYSPTALSSDVDGGVGMSVYLRPTTLDFVGALHTGPLNTGSFAPTGTGAKAGWRLLGNPYASPIDWDAVPTPANLSPTVFVWESAGGSAGIYRSRQRTGPNTGTGNLLNGVLPLGQGFFVRTTGPTAFTFTNAMRVTTYVNPALARPTAATAPELRLTLRADGGTVADETILHCPVGATLGATDYFDAAAPARNVGVPTLRTLGAAGEELAISALPEAALTAGLTVELLVEVPTAGTYKLSLAGQAGLTGLDVAVLDRLTGTRYDLTAQPTVAFTADRAGELTGRFALLFGQRVLGTSDPSTSSIGLTLSPNPTTETVHLNGRPGQIAYLIDATGRTVRTWSFAADGTAVGTVTGLVPGVYVVRCGTASARLLVASSR